MPFRSPCGVVSVKRVAIATAFVATIVLTAGGTLAIHSIRTGEKRVRAVVDSRIIRGALADATRIALDPPP